MTVWTMIVTVGPMGVVCLAISRSTPMRMYLDGSNVADYAGQAVSGLDDWDSDGYAEVLVSRRSVMTGQRQMLVWYT